MTSVLSKSTVTSTEEPNLQPKINFKGIPTKRNAPLVPGETALLIIDVQKLCCAPGFGIHRDVDPTNIAPEYKYFFDSLNEVVLPNIEKLLKEFRVQDLDIIFTCIESLTADGRDMSTDYKLSGISCPRGSIDAEICDRIKPVGPNEIYLPKSSCSVFNSTNIEYILRNLGTKYLIVTGVFTGACIESAVRDAADLGFFVHLCKDGCAAYTPQDHENGLKSCNGFANLTTTAAVLKELYSKRKSNL